MTPTLLSAIVNYKSICNTVWADQRTLQGNISYIALQPGQYLDIAQERGEYLDIAREHLSFDLHFDL